MKPPPFEYLAPETLEHALEALEQHGFAAKVLAGGQSLVPLLNFRLAEPAVLVDMNRVAELDYLEVDEADDLRIGAMTRQSTLERDPRVAQIAPLVAEAVPWIAHPQIRNRGTVGGSLAHADPAAEMPALAVALDARLEIRGPGGSRTVKAEDFFVGLMTTDLAPDELLTGMTIPRAAPRTGWGFAEIARRKGDYAHVGVAAVVTLDESLAVRTARIVYLSVGETPIAARRAAASLEGGRLGDEEIAEAARLAAREEIEPTDDIHATADFKIHLAEVVGRRALAAARERARGAK
jgi:carbon-monoxide dehydrogenase medium subunit